MNLDHLRTLVYVVEYGSLSAAARARRISQPAVTKQVQRMEAELGLPLLIRGPKREMELTPAGVRVLSFAEQTLASLEALEQELALFKEVGEGMLVLAASTIPGEYLLPKLLAAFRAEYPQLEIRMTISDTTEVVSRVLAGESDVGVIGSAPRRSGLRLQRLAGDEIVLAVPPNHAFAGRGAVTISELSDEPLVLREEGSGTRRSVEAALSKAGLSLPKENVKLVLGSTQAILQAVEQGLGLGFVSERAVARAQADGHLASVRLAGVDLARDLYLALRPERASDPLVARFVGFARSQFPQ
jgi:DNA-binding transcriptional LysR family regulator